MLVPNRFFFSKHLWSSSPNKFPAPKSGFCFHATYTFPLFLLPTFCNTASCKPDMSFISYITKCRKDVNDYFNWFKLLWRKLQLLADLHQAYRVKDSFIKVSFLNTSHVTQIAHHSQKPHNLTDLKVGLPPMADYMGPQWHNTFLLRLNPSRVPVGSSFHLTIKLQHHPWIKHCQYIHAYMHDEVPSKKKLEMSPWIPETPVLLCHFLAHLAASQTETVH